MTVGIRGSCIDSNESIQCLNYDDSVLSFYFTNSAGLIIQKTSGIKLEFLSEIGMLLSVSAIVICCALLLARNPTVWVKNGIVLCIMLPLAPITTAMIFWENATRAIIEMGNKLVTGQGVVFGWISFGTSLCGFCCAVVALLYNFEQ